MKAWLGFTHRRNVLTHAYGTWSLGFRKSIGMYIHRHVQRGAQLMCIETLKACTYIVSGFHIGIARFDANMYCITLCYVKGLERRF